MPNGELEKLKTDRGLLEVGTRDPMTGQRFERFTPTTTPPPTAPPTAPTTAPTGITFDPTKRDPLEEFRKAITGQREFIGEGISGLPTERERRREEISTSLETQLAELERQALEQGRRIQEEERRTLGGARGVNIRAGLAGSPFAEGLKKEIRTGAERARTSLEERTLAAKSLARSKAQQALFDIEEAFNTRESALRQQQLGLAEAEFKLDETAIEKAKQNIADLVQSPTFTGIDQFKLDLLDDEGNPLTDDQGNRIKLWDILKEQTGLDDLRLDLFINSKIPPAEQPTIEQRFLPTPDGGTKLLRIKSYSDGRVETDEHILDVPYSSISEQSPIQFGDDLVVYDPSTDSYKSVFRKAPSREQLLKEEKLVLDIKLARQKLDEEGANSSNISNQFAFLENAVNDALLLADASGRSGFRRGLEEEFAGATDFTKLSTLVDSIKTNVLSLAQDPSIKDFFGPRMSDNDVRLMMSAGTILNAESLEPEDMKQELTRVLDVFKKLRNEAEKDLKDEEKVVDDGFTSYLKDLENM